MKNSENYQTVCKAAEIVSFFSALDMDVDNLCREMGIDITEDAKEIVVRMTGCAKKGIQLAKEIQRLNQ